MFLKMDLKVRCTGKNLLFYYTKRADFFLVPATRLRFLCAEFCCYIYIYFSSYLYFSQYLEDQLLWVHFAKKIGCITLLIQYLQVICAWHTRDTKEERNRDELAKRRERFHIKKDGETMYKVAEENRTSVEDARQKHVQILEKVYGAQRLVSKTSSRASVSTTTTTVVPAILTTTTMSYLPQ